MDMVRAKFLVARWPRNSILARGSSDRAEGILVGLHKMTAAHANSESEHLGLQTLASHAQVMHPTCGFQGYRLYTPVRDGPVAQPDRTSAFEAEGWEFESLRGRDFANPLIPEMNVIRETKRDKIVKPPLKPLEESSHASTLKIEDLRPPQGWRGA